jgi:hypothetical protein
MTFEYMFTHDLIISQGYAPRGRGIIPEKIKKLVEAGTKDVFTLLSDKRQLQKPLTIQKLLKESIFIKNNTCGHRYKIALGEFIKSDKACITCLSPQVSTTSVRKTVICNSLHNAHAI